MTIQIVGTSPLRFNRWSEMRGCTIYRSDFLNRKKNNMASRRAVKTEEPNGQYPASNDGADDIAFSEPYTVTVQVTGTATMLFHAWSNEAVAEKAAARKGSAAKKTDNVESYVYRNDKNHICIPGKYLIGTLINKQNGAAKFIQDPRSPRKSAVDLFKAGIVSLTELAPIVPVGSEGPTRNWDYIDRQRVTVQQAGITRERPAFKAGWRAEFQLMCLLPEYISPDLLHITLTRAGMLVGLADYRPTYGRFRLDSFKVLKA